MLARWLALAAALVAATAAAPDLVPVPPLTGRIVDLTGSLTPAQTRELDASLALLEQRKGAQIAVLMLPTTAPEPIETYSIRVAEAWRIGRGGVDDGIVVVVALQDRAMRIEVGYGLEGAVPDAVARRLIEEHFLPGFRQGDYFAGLRAGLGRLVAVVEGEPLPPPQRVRPGSERGAPFDYLPLLLFVVFGLGGVLRLMLGRVGAASAAGAVAGVAGWWIAGSLLIALLLAMAGFVLTLLGGAGGFLPRGRSGGWGGLGGGGFRGGGGGFGGGGASGRW